MDRKQRFQQDLREAVLAKDLPRVGVLRILLDEYDDAQKALGKQAIDTANSYEPGIQQDRQQVLSELAVQYIIRKEL